MDPCESLKEIPRSNGMISMVSSTGLNRIVGAEVGFRDAKENNVLIPTDLIRRFHSALPSIRQWIEDLLEDTIQQATPIFNLAFPRLPQVFSSELLMKAKVVVVPGRVPFPPLSHMGLSEFAPMEKMPIAGITYIDTFFINRALQTESLHFHELVHVVQWERLGVDNFLLAYGVGLMQFGYRDSPLEQMAYWFQDGFDRRRLRLGIVELIQQKTDAIWVSVNPVITKSIDQ
jgi:hypothetical protein